MKNRQNKIKFVKINKPLNNGVGTVWIFLSLSGLSNTSIFFEIHFRLDNKNKYFRLDNKNKLSKIIRRIKKIV